MDREEILDQLFELSLQMHGFALGALIRPGRLSSEQAIEEVEPFRKKLAELYERAGRAVPTYLQREEKP